MKDFLSEETIEAPDGWTSATALYAAFKGWCQQREIDPLTVTAFGIEVAKVYTKERTKAERGYSGVELRGDGLAVSPISSLKKPYKKRKGKNPSPVTARIDRQGNVDHEPYGIEDEVPEPTLKEQRELIEYYAQLQEEELQMTARDWEMTPSEIEALLADEGQ